MDNGLGGATRYSGVRGSDWREHSDTKIDDVILKGRYRIDGASRVTAMLQRYEGKAEMPGGLTTAAFARDPYESTRPYDNFWGRRNLASLAYEYRPDRQRQLTVQAFYTDTLRSGYLDQGRNLTLSPRNTRCAAWKRAMRKRFGPARRAMKSASATASSMNPAMNALLAPETGRHPADRKQPHRPRYLGHRRADALFIDDRIESATDHHAGPAQRTHQVLPGQ